MYIKLYSVYGYTFYMIIGSVVFQVMFSERETNVIINLLIIACLVDRPLKVAHHRTVVPKRAQPCHA